MQITADEYILTLLEGIWLEKCHEIFHHSHPEEISRCCNELLEALWSKCRQPLSLILGLPKKTTPYWREIHECLETVFQIIFPFMLIVFHELQYCRIRE